VGRTSAYHVRGSTFAGRVAASLLRAVGLPELITDTLALILAKHRTLLQSYRDRLTRDPARLPLFDTARTTQQIEMAYVGMMARCNNDELPATFSVLQ
jgi:protein O-GlcNAc transferase